MAQHNSGDIHESRVIPSLALVRAEFFVDTGATDSMAPAVELQRIGLTPVGRKVYELGDGSDGGAGAVRS
jgi:hypothetical protein